MTTSTFEKRATRSDTRAKTLLIPPSRKATGKRPRLSQESASTKLLAEKVATEVRFATEAAATALANKANAHRVAILDAATEAAHAAELACNKETIDDLKATVGSLKADLACHKETYTRDKNELVTFSIRLKAEAVDLVANVNDKTHKLSHYNTWAAGLNKAHVELINQVHELAGENKVLTVANAKLRFRIESQQKTMNEYTDNIGFEHSELRHKCEKLRVESDGRQKECARLRHHNADVREENNVLRSRVKQLLNAAAIRPASWATPDASVSYGASLACAI